jgi:hypothetical protein
VIVLVPFGGATEDNQIKDTPLPSLWIGRLNLREKIMLKVVDLVGWKSGWSKV